MATQTYPTQTPPNFPNQYQASGSAAFGSNIVVALAYDRLVEFALRPQLVYRQFVDKRPQALTQPGTTIRLQKYVDLFPSLGSATALSGATISAPSAGAINPILDETIVVDPILFTAPSTVDLLINEYGRTVVLTKTLIQQAISDVDTAAVNMLAWDMANTMELAIEPILRGGTNRLGPTTTPKALATITTGDNISTAQLRRGVALMRTNFAPPIKENMYGCLMHPAVSFDLRSESGAGSWREPHVYNATGNIWNGELGGYEGAFFVETPRAYQGLDGLAAAKVTRTTLIGRQALAEAVVEEPHLLWGPVVDPLMRLQPLSWYAVLGWAVFRQESLYRLESATTF